MDSEEAALRRDDDRACTRYVCDVVRAMLTAKDMGVVGAICDALVELSKNGIIQIVRIKDRFRAPSAGGWRDLMINLTKNDTVQNKENKAIAVMKQGQYLML